MTNPVNDNPLTTILCIDDEEDLRNIAGFALESVGKIKTTLCASASEALDYLRNAEVPPQLILLDVNMPDVDGPSALAVLHATEIARNIPVVFLTGESDVDVVSQLKALGAVDVIIKPFDPMTLARRVQAIWASLG